MPRSTVQIRTGAAIYLYSHLSDSEDEENVLVVVVRADAFATHEGRGEGTYEDGQSEEAEITQTVDAK